MKNPRRNDDAPLLSPVDVITRLGPGTFRCKAGGNPETGNVIVVLHFALIPRDALVHAGELRELSPVNEPLARDFEQAAREATMSAGLA